VAGAEGSPFMVAMLPESQPRGGFEGRVFVYDSASKKWLKSGPLPLNLFRNRNAINLRIK
jgi:hypothetical protein